MTPVSGMSSDVMQHIKSFWEKKQFLDFTVQIGDVTIGCHRIVLAACSGIFRDFFSSGKEGASANTATVRGISSGTFYQLMKCVYTGETVVTQENLVHVWTAAHLLQVQAVVDLCEQFALSRLHVQNFEEIGQTARRLNSRRVLQETEKFMLMNFDPVCRTRTFLGLSDEEVKRVVRSQDLVVSSEGVVFESVLNWAEFVPDKTEPEDRFEICFTITLENGQKPENGFKNNESSYNCKDNVELVHARHAWCYHSNDSKTRSPPQNRVSKLHELLLDVRTFLVDQQLLQTALTRQMLGDNTDAMKMILTAVRNKQETFHHGQWPSSGIHRQGSQLANVGVFTRSDGKISALSAVDEQWFYISLSHQLQHRVELCVFDSQLLAVGLESHTQETCKMFAFDDYRWTFISEIPCRDPILVSHGNYIYIINIEVGEIHYLNPIIDTTVLFFVAIPANFDVKYVMSYERRLLFFGSVSKNVTIVRELDVQSRTWTSTSSLPGPASNMTSLKDDSATYILQPDGTIRTVTTTSAGHVTFTLVARLWEHELNIRGAITCQGKLILYFQKETPNSVRHEAKKEIPGIFREIRYWKTTYNGSHFLPVVLPKRFLLPLGA